MSTASGLEVVLAEPIINQGQVVPVVAFYSVQGGVGKSTLARKFAELVTLAPGRDGRRPNVLLIDLDVEAQGLTFRLTSRLRHIVRTVHEVIAERNAALPQAVNVTGEVSLAGGNPQERGQLFLMPAAPPDARGLFDTIAQIDRKELLQLLSGMISALVAQYDVSAVVIDCAPGASPYTAAAATLSEFPLLIGRNEQTTYDQIRILPERFREMYPQFQPAKQRVIINAVSVKEIYQDRAQQYSVFDYIPLTSDVIFETEGLPRIGSMQMMLFEKYIADIIRQVFVGKKYLIPEAREIAGQEWIDRLAKLARCERAPKIRTLLFFRYFAPAGIGFVIVGLGLFAGRFFFESVPERLAQMGLWTIVVGACVAAFGWYAQKERFRIIATARDLVLGGPEEILKKLKDGQTARRLLDEMERLAATIPD